MTSKSGLILLGRNTILAAMDIGFDISGWLIKLRVPQISSVNYKIQRDFVSSEEYEKLEREGPEIHIDQ